MEHDDRVSRQQRSVQRQRSGLLMDKNYFVSLLRKNRLLKYQLYQHQLQYRKNESELAQLASGGGVKKPRKNDLNASVAMATTAANATNHRYDACHVVVRKLSHLNFKRNKKTTTHHVSTAQHDSPWRDLDL